MAEIITNTYSAAPSLIGYVYQIYLALSLLAREAGQPLASEDQLAVSIELIDDVAIHKTGSVQQSVQSKSHLDVGKTLTDSHPDVWKTLRVWLDNENAGEKQTLRCLVTTQDAEPNSACSYLRADNNRDLAKATARLDAYAAGSGSAALAPAVAAWTAQTHEQKLAFLGTVFVNDQAADIQGICDELGRSLFRHKGSDERIQMMADLTGWWMSRVISHLYAIARDKRDDTISWLEVRVCLDRIMSRYALDGLPNEFGTAEPGQPINPAADGRLFVHQLRSIDVPLGTIRLAIRDHWRATEQRSKWTRDLRILPDELTTYDSQIVDEWEHCADEHWTTPDVDAPHLQHAGVTLFRELNKLIVPLRSFSEPFLTRGTLHRLADGTPARVGWHPGWEAICETWTKSKGVPSESAA